MHLPSEKRSKGKSSTVNTLKYALRCVKQVKGKSCFWLLKSQFDKCGSIKASHRFKKVYSVTDVCIFSAANEEYYQMLMTNDSQPPGFDVSSYTIEEINRITSEYTLKNTVSTSNLHLTVKEEHQVTFKSTYLFCKHKWRQVGVIKR